LVLASCTDIVNVKPLLFFGMFNSFELSFLSLYCSPSNLLISIVAAI
jgi:hypothetical protein